MRAKITAAVLIVLSMLALLPLTAGADVLYTPNDSFYNRHSSECTYLGRSFYANGRSGYITLRTEPGAGSEVAALQNGTELYINFTYNLRGEAWGVAEFYETNKTDGVQKTGWVTMSDLTVVYDYIEFGNDHHDEFYYYGAEANTTGDLVLWTWPGSGKYVHVYSSSDRHPGEGMNDVMPAHLYRDPEGREWGYISYFYGMRNVWYCIDDPSNKEIPAFNKPPAPELWPAADPEEIPPLKAGFPIEWIIVILVVIVVVGAVILIQVFRKREKN